MNKSNKTPLHARVAEKHKLKTKTKATMRRSQVASIRQHLSTVDPAVLAPDAIEAYKKLQEQLDTAHKKAQYNGPYMQAMRYAESYFKVMYGFADLEKVERHRVSRGIGSSELDV